MTIGPQTSWTDEQGETAKTLYLSGKSASQIARELGAGHSRNAVIGKLHRMKVTREPIARKVSMSLASVHQRRGPGSGSVSAQAKSFGASQPLPPRAPIPAERQPVDAVPLERLEAHMCKWPLGDPSKAGFGFCGARMGEREPYCDHHAAKAFVPANAKSDKSSAGHVLRLCAA